MLGILNRMKKLFVVTGLFILVCGFFPVSTYAASTHVAVAANFNMLKGHGEWMEHSKFGSVWRPHVAHGWRPYFYGEWIWTDNGWFWDSYEPFGWVTYHYGRWWYTNEDGWFWIPGDVWGPAWVSWSNFDNYVGWAPLPPDGYSWSDPWDVGPVFVWNVVFVKDFCRHEIDKHIITRTIERPHDTKQVERNSPRLQRIETAGNMKVEKKIVTREKVHSGNHVVERPQLPKDHMQTTRPFRNRVERQIMLPHPVGKHH
jgi:hypothetical protein